tara:strand:- start:849 stop:1247 length:399 start_codon:yes stop_codon:yes gene_type:complete
MADISEVLAGLQQAAANAYDGGEETGALKREEGNPLLDFRVNDDFKVRFQGNKLYVTYSVELPRKEYHERDFDLNLQQTIEDLVSYLKKEYKKVTGNSVSLSKDGDMDSDLEYISNIKVLVKATCPYKISGL